MTEVPTLSLDHLTPTQARAFMIADNRLTEIATWDEVRDEAGWIMPENYREAVAEFIPYQRNYPLPNCLRAADPRLGSNRRPGRVGRARIRA